MLFPNFKFSGGLGTRERPRHGRPQWGWPYIDATGMATPAIGPAVAAMGKEKAAPGVVLTGTIAAGMAANLVPTTESQYIAATYLQPPPECDGGLGCHIDSTNRRRGLELCRLLERDLLKYG